MLRMLPFRFTSLNVMTSFNAIVMSLQYGGSQQSKFCIIKHLPLETEDVQEKDYRGCEG